MDMQAPNEPNERGAMMETEETEIFLCDEDAVNEGEPHRVDIPGRPPFAVYKAGGGVYVTEDTCSHGQASLGDEGEQDGFNIICTWHDGVFDIRTGEPKSMPCTKPIKTYRAIVRDGGIHILVA
jgi:nitrite reductase/ring-hydroxylating ferredoxin subunit